MVGRRALRVLAVGIAVVLHLSMASPSDAHGSTVNIALACSTPDPARPLIKVCTAFLKYTDGDPVLNARFQVTAEREGGAERPVGPVAFQPLEGAGVYSATITFPAYGTWRMKFEVRAPGRGEAEVAETILPPLPGAAPELRARLQVVFTFGIAELGNLAVRILHFLASALWLALVFLVFMLSLLLPPEQRRRPLQRVAGVFPWAAGGSLILITISGLYNALYNVPTRAPGVLAPQELASLPFGTAYLTAFYVKMGLVLAIVVSTTMLAGALRGILKQPAAISGGTLGAPALTPDQPVRRVRRLAAVNLLLGLLTFANVVVLGYLHIISHVGGAIGAP